MNKQQNSEVSAFLPMLQKGIGRSIALLSDGYLSAIDIVQLFTASFFFVSWIFLSPFLSFNSQSQRKVEGIRQKVEASP
ncbi:MAG: hypothetical protein EAZ60_15465 [Oscillatoriales cyanobacterium]|nr:MAG: hypothetical protein EAZ60_15465 [Oscillatoriales cyanobacterium]